MQQVKLDSPLNFIRQKDLIEFYIIHENGANLIQAGSYKQNVKKSELDQIMQHNIYKSIPQKPKTSKDLFAEAKLLKEKEESDVKAKAEKEAEDEKIRLANLAGSPDKKQSEAL